MLQASAQPKHLQWQTGVQPPSIADPAAKSGGELVFAVGELPSTLRPFGPTTDTPLSDTLKDLLWPLVGIGAENQLVPLLATQWAVSADGQTIAYRLDPKARWSDGTPVTAKDVEQTLNIMNAAGDASFATRGFSTAIIDRRTIAFRFKEPQREGAAFARFPILPAHVYTDTSTGVAARYDATMPPTTGPYTLTNPTKSTRVMTRTPNWWAADRSSLKGRFNVDRITLTVVAEGDASFRAFADGPLDGIAFNDSDDWQTKARAPIFQKGYATRIATRPLRPRDCIGLWLNTRHGQLADSRIRAALISAIDFDMVAGKVWSGEVERLAGCYDGYGLSVPPRNALPFSPLAGAAALDSANFTLHDPFGVRQNAQGVRLSFPLVFLRGSDERVIKSIQDGAAAIGIQLTLRAVSAEEWVNLRDSDGYGLFYGGFRATTDGVPDWRAHWHSSTAVPGGHNLTRLADPVVDALIEAFEKETEAGPRARHARIVEGRIAAAAIFLPGLVRVSERVAVKRWVKVPLPHPGGPRPLLEPFEPLVGGRLWVDTAERAATLAAIQTGRTFEPQTVIDKAADSRHH